MTDIVLPVGTYPQNVYAGHVATATRLTVVKDVDLINPPPNVLAMPNCPITVLNAGSFSVAATFPGMHIADRFNDDVEGVTFKSVRSHDMRSGTGMWRAFEPTAPVGGVHTYDWTNLDLWYAAHLAAGREMVFTLFGSPRWAVAAAKQNEIGMYGAGYPGVCAEPEDMANWSAFCTALATRYPGIQYYEVWNEPNMNNNGTTTSGSSFFFSGTWAKLAEMVRLANQAIKAVRPAAKIVSPAVQGWAATANASDTYFLGMLDAPDGAVGKMKDWVDVIAVHLYSPTFNRTQDLPAIINRIGTLKTTAGVSSLETWDTESGPIGTGHEVSDLADAEAWRLMLRAMVVMAAKGIARTFYYQYDHGTMGFVGRDYLIREREALIARLREGMYGASMFTDGRVVYSCSGGQYVI